MTAMWKAHLNAYLLKHPRVDYKTAQKRASKTYQKMKKESMAKPRRKSVMDDRDMQSQIMQLNLSAQRLRERIPRLRQEMQESGMDPQYIQTRVQEMQEAANHYSSLAQRVQRILPPRAF